MYGLSFSMISVLLMRYVLVCSAQVPQRKIEHRWTPTLHNRQRLNSIDFSLSHTHDHLLILDSDDTLDLATSRLGYDEGVEWSGSKSG
ncbi:hypothetical protein C8R42DRAFT_664151 [Lentinula raphanica]|nr:hypothetical protein C8R42DRAFT_664151 [Lentinula raphanica]